MDIYLIWWLIALFLLMIELLTGTFYLLVASIALMGAGLAAWLNGPLMIQISLAIGLGIGGIVLLRTKRRRISSEELVLDVGHPVKVITWLDEKRARVTYRGTQWDAELLNEQASKANLMYIAKTRGSILLITDQPLTKD